MTTINYPGTVNDLAVGDIVEYQPFGGGTRIVKVTNVDAGDYPDRGGVFDGKLVDAPHSPNGVWGYGEQIRSIRKPITRKVQVQS
jgi:hypothetical protein